jgi:23S rRNA pseudouridine1911/1915/1917 synthase
MFSVEYEDESLMIINKPRGVVVHPGAGVTGGTLMNELLRVNADPTLDRAGIVHRLDKNTAGLLIVAKTAEAQAALKKMFEDHKIKRTYLGLVEGRIKADMTIDKNIIRHPKHRTIFTAAVGIGRRAITHLRVLEQYNKYTLCEFTLETGRTHQIRVHCKAISHPIVGDREYNPNGNIKSVPGQMLEAVKLEFVHPLTKQDIKIEIPATKEFANIKRKCYIIK